MPRVEAVGAGVFPKPLKKDSGSSPKEKSTPPEQKPRFQTPMQTVYTKVETAVICGGVVRTIIALPPETVKLLVQSTGNGVVATTKEIFEKKGVKGFYSGYGAYATMASCNALVKNAAIDFATQSLSERGVPTPAKILGAAAFTAAIEAGVLPYIQVMDGIQARAAALGTTETVSVAREMYRIGGVRTFFYGAPLTGARQFGWIAGYLAMLEVGTAHLGLTDAQMVGWGTLSGGVAGLISCPPDVVRSRMICTVPGTPKITIREAFRSVVTSDGGYRNLYRGIGAKAITLCGLGLVRPLIVLVGNGVKEFHSTEGTEV